MSDSQTYREKVIVAFRDRLRKIARTNGFVTNAGRTILIGSVAQLGPDDPTEAIALTVDNDEVKRTGEHVLCRVPFTFSAVVRIDQEDCWIKVERILGDIKRAIELPDRTLGGLIRDKFERGNTNTSPRETGSMVVSAEVTYWAWLPERWGEP